MLFSRASRWLLVVLVLLGMSAASFAAIGISITIGPPALPVYEQPPCPAPGYMWTPGYWAYGPYGYYWVPGTWVLAPQPGYLWTPPWWGWEGGLYIFHAGYWGTHVGFYGGVPYGFGYFGHGYEGGRWQNGQFFYNRSVNNVNVTNIHNVYNTTVINNNSTTVNRVSYNGGPGGIDARPTQEEEAVEHEQHIAPTASQTHQAQAAFTNPQLRASENQGKPPIAATPKVGAFNDRGAVAAREAGATYRPENNVPRPPNTTVHAKDLPSVPRPTAPVTGNAKLDQKYQQQQDKLYAKQEQEHQQLQQQQERDHQQLDRQNASDAQRQAVEQKHQQQTQQMEERHAQEQQQLSARQHPSGGGHGR
jgi:hypothetical protein